MGLFEQFRQYQAGRKQKRIERATRLVKNAKAIKEDRWAAIEYLSSISDVQEAIPALLERFEYSLEHGINDTREKELAMTGIVRHGADVVPIIKEHLKKTTRIAWPIKVLRELGTEDELADILVDCLDFSDVSFDQAAVDKNYDILCYLRDHKVPRHVDRLKHFLQDADERVRFACSEVLIEQENPAVAPALEPFLGDDSSENRRIKQSVLKAFLRFQWKLSRPEDFAEVQIEPGIQINQNGTLVAAGRH